MQHRTDVMLERRSRRVFAVVFGPGMSIHELICSLVAQKGEAHGTDSRGLRFLEPRPGAKVGGGLRF